MSSIALDSKRWETKLKRIGGEAANKVVSLAAFETGQDVVRKARKEERHRYNTHSSNLNRSIQTEMQGNDAVIGFDESVANYGKYQHDGTTYIKADRFIDRAVLDSRDDYHNNLEKQFNKAVK